MRAKLGKQIDFSLFKGGFIGCIALEREESKVTFLFTISALMECKQDHLRMNVAPDRKIILGLQIVLDNRSLSSIGQKILMILPEACFDDLEASWRTRCDGIGWLS